MKLLVTIVDGLGDEVYGELGNKTPLDFAKTPNFEKLGKSGSFGYLDTEKKGFPIESSYCILNIFGAEEKAFSIGRSFYEAKAMGIDVSKGQSVIRLNIVSTDESGALTSFNALGLTNAQVEKVFQTIEKKYPMTYFMGGYKGLMFFQTVDISPSSLSLSPHENLGQNYNN
ncbi:MAG: hypothetical protein RSC41_03505, partial [Oscillospiraceae bacterium]